MKTSELLNALQNNNIDDIIDIIPDINFTEYLEALLSQSGLKKAEVIKKANLHREYGYQIFKGIRTPDKDKIICISLAMHLSVEETNRLLSLSNNGSLYAKVARDAIVIYCLNNKLDVMATNEMLLNLNFKALE